MGTRGCNQKSFACYEELPHLRVTDESNNVSIYKRRHAQKHLPIEQRSFIVHIPVPQTKGGIRQSLRVNDRHTAIRKAENMVLQIKSDIRQGVKVIGVPVEDCVRRFLIDKKARIRGKWDGKNEAGKKTITAATYKRIKGTLNNYVIPFLGKRTDIKSVSIKKFDDEWELWRRQNHKRKEMGNPKAITIMNEMVLIREFWNWCINKGDVAVNKKPFMDEDFVKDEEMARDTWEKNEWDSFKVKVRYWLKEQEKKSEAEYWDSWVAYQMLFMFVNSGLRMGEAVKLKNKDVLFTTNEGSENEYQNGQILSLIQVHKSNKTGAREVTCAATEYIVRVMKKSKFKKQEDWLFCHLNGEPFTTKQFRTQFESMTAYTNEDERWGKHFVPYSLRSYYATIRLLNGTNTYDLCKQMGTGEQQLKNHYSKYMTRLASNELIKVRKNIGLRGKVFTGKEILTEEYKLRAS